MVVKEPLYKHYFTVKQGKFIWEDQEMFNYKKLSLEGRRGYSIIEEVEDTISPNQYAYYFGGIIRKECMRSNTFHGFTDKEIHQILFAELRSSTKGILMPDGTTRLVTVTDDFSKYGKKQMAKYIEEVIAHLQVKYNIHPRPADHYKYNKFYLNEESL